MLGRYTILREDKIGGMDKIVGGTIEFVIRRKDTCIG